MGNVFPCLDAKYQTHIAPVGEPEHCDQSPTLSEPCGMNLCEAQLRAFTMNGLDSKALDCLGRDDKHALSVQRSFAWTRNRASKPTAPLTFGGLHAVHPLLPAHSACAAQQPSEHRHAQTSSGLKLYCPSYTVTSQQ